MIGVLEIDTSNNVVYSYLVEADKCQTVFVKGETCWELEDYQEGWSNCKAALGTEKLQILLLADKFTAAAETLLNYLKNEIKELEASVISTGAVLELCESKLHIKPRGKIKNIHADCIILENGNTLSYVTLGGSRIGEMVKEELPTPAKANEVKSGKKPEKVSLNDRRRVPGKPPSSRNEKPQLGPLPERQEQEKLEVSASKEAMYIALQQRKKNRDK